MKNSYDVIVLDIREVHELPGAWENDDFLDLLKHLDYADAADIAGEELKEMAAMALSDFDPEEAAVRVLEYRIGEKLNKGQRQNIAEEIKGERLWEEYAEIGLHEELFNTSCMLYWAFPKLFSEPDIVQINLKVKALSPNAVPNLKAPTSSFIARLLNDGMGAHNTIYRLFKDNLSSYSFPEAQDIIWKYNLSDAGYDESDQSVTFTIYTSWNWVDELKGVNNYESTAYSDK